MGSESPSFDSDILNRVEASSGISDLVEDACSAWYLS